MVVIVYILLLKCFDTEARDVSLEGEGKVFNY